MMLNRALLVDDSKSARFALRKLLERSGIQVDVAESGEQALDYLAQNHPDLIFMDHLMPGMDGFEAATAIKQLPERNKIPIIMCTSKEGDGYADEARAHGAADILPKPATPSALTDVLQRVRTRTDQIPDPVAVATEISVPAADRPLASEPPMLTDAVLSPQTPEPPDDAASQLSEVQIKQLIEDLLPERMNSLFEAQVPKLRTQVLSSFDKIAPAIVEACVTQQLDKWQPEATEQTPSPGLSEEDVESLAQAQVQRLVEPIQRDLNEQVADIYSNIGELKANRQVRNLAPELMEDILSRAQAAATEQANEVLLQVSEIAQNTARQAAEEMAQRLTADLQERFDKKLAKAIESGIESARQQAVESAWEKAEQEHLALRKKIGRQGWVSGLTFILAGGALALVVYTHFF